MKTFYIHIAKLKYAPISRRSLVCMLSLLMLFLALPYNTVSAKENRTSVSKKDEVESKTAPEKTGIENSAPEGMEESGHGVSFEEMELGEMGFDETSVYMDMQRLGGREVNTLLRNNMVYLSVTDVFDFLKIRNIPSPGLDSITGFFIDINAKYTIDNAHNIIRYKGQTWKLTPENMVRTAQHLYLRSDYFNTVFGLECIFDSYNLSVKLNSKQEMPAVMEKMREEARNNISQLKGTIKADTTFKRTYPKFHFGAADWAVYSFQRGNYTENRGTLGLGAVILGGETNIGLNYSSQQPFDEKQQYYLWRYANNDNPLVKQVMLGKIATGSIASIYAPVVGVQFTNRPTTFRRSFGSYNISDVTGPNWIVELYVNNVLVDYTKADASGFYSLNVPLVYGRSDIRLRFYGQYGEIQTKDQRIEIPVNFLPSGESEYFISSGLVEDGRNSAFSRGVVNYGVSRGVTMGGGLEYLSSVKSGNFMPFATTSVKLVSNMYFSGDYTYGVRGRGFLIYQMPSNIQFQLNYTKYTKGQTAILFNYDEERKASISVPLHTKGFGALTRLTAGQITLPGSTKQSMAEWLVSTSFNRFSVNLTTNMTSIRQSEIIEHSSSFYSNLSVSVRLPHGLIITPQAQYDYLRQDFYSLRCSAEKMVTKRGYLNMGVDHYPLTNTTNATIGFRYDFSFARVSTQAGRYNNEAQFSQAAAGSLLYDKNSDYSKPGNRLAVGRAAIAVIPFLDANGNGRRDEGESRVSGVKVIVGGGQITYQDTAYYITDLEPYSGYLVQINSDGVENISWQPKFKTIKVTPNANSMTLVEVPYSVVGEVSGIVSVKRTNAKKAKGLGQIVINIYNKDSALIAHTMSESDGFFSYNGLKAGTYYLQVDTAQLRKINYTSLTGTVPVTIAQTADGDLVDGIEFALQNNNPEKEVFTKIPVSTVDKEEEKHKTYSIFIDLTDELTKAEKIKTAVVRKFRLPVSIVPFYDDYIIEILGFETRKEAEKVLENVLNVGYYKAIVSRPSKPE